MTKFYALALLGLLSIASTAWAEGDTPSDISAPSPSDDETPNMSSRGVANILALPHDSTTVTTTTYAAPAPGIVTYSTTAPVAMNDGSVGWATDADVLADINNPAPVETNLYGDVVVPTTPLNTSSVTTTTITTHPIVPGTVRHNRHWVRD